MTSDSVNKRGAAPVVSLLIMAVLAAFTPVLRWYFERITDGSDEPFGVIALLVVVSIAALRSCAMPTRRTVLTIVTIITVHVFTAPYLPPLVEGVLMSVALAVLVSNCYFSRSIHIGVVGLLVISLPLIASLQFFLGFPVRAVTTEIVAHLLSSVGWPVYADGTVLTWRGEVVAIDAPCAGIRMLWGGLFLHFTLSTVRNLPNAYTLLGYTLTVGIVFLGNILRTFLLFFTESKLIDAPQWAHMGIGVFCFTIVVTLIFFGHTVTPVRRGIYDASEWRVVATVREVCLSSIFCIAAGFLLSPTPMAHTTPVEVSFPGWPSQFQGIPLLEVGLSAEEQRWTQGFPGRINRFTDGTHEILLRWVPGATRKLHPASDCMQALGYTTQPVRMRKDRVGSLWNCFDARSANRSHLKVCEQVQDGAGQTWSDTSTWYWYAVFRSVPKGYWAWSVAERLEEA